MSEPSEPEVPVPDAPIVGSPADVTRPTVAPIPSQAEMMEIIRKLERRLRDIEHRHEREVAKVKDIEAWPFAKQSREILAWIVEESGEHADDLLTKALAVYKASIEEEARGHRMAFLDADDTIVREIGGFLVRLDPMPQAK